MAQLDPLGLRRMALRLGVNRDEKIPDTNPQLYGFSDEDWDRPLNLEGAYSESQGGLLRSADIDGDGNTTFGELMTFLHKTYSGTSDMSSPTFGTESKSTGLQTKLRSPSTTRLLRPRSKFLSDWISPRLLSLPWRNGSTRQKGLG